MPKMSLVTGSSPFLKLISNVTRWIHAWEEQMSIALGGLLSLGVVTHPAVSYSRVTERYYLEDKWATKEEGGHAKFVTASVY